MDTENLAIPEEQSGETAETGFVYFVGAGPGEPDLLTLKGKKVIQSADVLLYDRLVSDELLNLSRADCELICVGKVPGAHSWTQAEINELLVKTAAAGKLVVRLKGGDPFVFGRGSEEALALREQGIGFEIVPGVSSAIAVPAYAGIPVTHRGMASSFSVITGHEDPQKDESALDWDHLSKIEGTLVFLMGMSNLPLITQQLMQHGKDAKTPAAIIEEGASPCQRSICGTLDTIAELASQHQLQNPAVIVVGEVVNLRTRLAWFESKPLFGERILVTRARHQASKLSAALSELGARVDELPVIDIVAPPHPEELSKAVRELGSYTWLIVTSVNGVEALFAEIYARGYDVRQLAGIQLVAVGPATKQALERRGLRNIIMPSDYHAEGVAEAVSSRLNLGDRVLLVQAQEARAVIPARLARTCASVTDVAAYKTIPAALDGEALAQALRNGTYDAVCFTSSSTVHNLVSITGGDTSVLQEVKRYSIGPITSKTLRDYGLEPTAQAKDYCIQGLVDSLVQYTLSQEAQHV